MPHHWLKENDQWFIYCKETGEKFVTKLWFNKPELQGLCPFCKENAKLELERKKRVKEERKRQMEMSEELRQKNTLEGYFL